MILRSRVLASSNPTVYVDAAHGLDSNDGTCPYSISNPPGVGPVQTLQCAFDFASKNFDLSPPLAWTFTNYVGRRSGVTVQMAPSTAAAPYILSAPAYLDGLGASGPVKLRGNSADPFSYYIRADNNLQGLTAQEGAHLYLEGFAIFGEDNCTLINVLCKGRITIGDGVWCGPSTGTGKTAAVGAAGGAQLDILGILNLWGSGFVAVATAIEEGRIIIAKNAGFNLSNPMDVGTFIGLQHASCWTQGVPPVILGAGATAGQKFSLTGNSYCSIHGADTILPGFGYTLSQASTALDASGAPLAPNTSGP